MEAKLVPVRIPYRETITKSAEAQGRHKKQTGGAGQFGDCWLRLAPIPGEGYEFVDEIKGGAIPNGLIPAVDKGVREAMEEGFLAGYPMVDIRCTVFDGSYHSVDSNEMAFKTAAIMAFKKGFMEASPVLLEPISSLKVIVPDKYTGDVMGDLNKRRGRVLGMNPDHKGNQIIEADIPTMELYGYSTTLRAMTGGSGDFSYEFARYEQAPSDIQKKEVEERASKVNNNVE